MGARDVFESEEVERARAYHRPLYAVWALAVTIDLAGLAALSFGALGDLLLDPLDDVAWWGEAFFATVVALVLTALLTLPLALWAGFLRERRYGLSPQSLLGWVADRVKGMTVSAVLVGTAVLGLVALARAFPRGWPLVAGAAAAGLVVLLGFVAPVVLEPLFSRFAPLEDEELAGSLRHLADDAGVPVQQV